MAAGGMISWLEALGDESVRTGLRKFLRMGRRVGFNVMTITNDGLQLSTELVVQDHSPPQQPAPTQPAHRG